MPRHPDLLIERLSQPAAAALIAASGTAVVATGSVEQHGKHLPLGTDAFAAASIAERVAARLGTVVASLGPAGVAPYHLSWPGTLSLRPATLAAVMVDVCGGLHGAGAHRIVVVNWHEGNSPTLRLAADEAQRRYGVQVVIAESHVITHTLYPEEMEFTHAGSMETAAVLAYDAALVHLENAAEPSERQAAETAHGLFRRPDVYPVLRDFRQIAATGWYGRPERATPTGRSRSPRRSPTMWWPAPARSGRRSAPTPAAVQRRAPGHQGVGSSPRLTPRSPGRADRNERDPGHHAGGAAARLRRARHGGGADAGARAGRGARARAGLRDLRHRPEDRGRPVPGDLAAGAAVHHRP